MEMVLRQSERAFENSLKTVNKTSNERLKELIIRLLNLQKKNK
jgi:hypothetical protein